jgi:hypothetical protein
MDALSKSLVLSCPIYCIYEYRVSMLTFPFTATLHLDRTFFFDGFPELAGLDSLGKWHTCRERKLQKKPVSYPEISSLLIIVELHMSGMGLLEIPSEIAATPSLRYFDVSNNALQLVPEAYFSAECPIGKSSKLSILFVAALFRKFIVISLSSIYSLIHF